MSIQTEYEAHIKPEIESLVEEISHKLLINSPSDISDYHKGWRVFFSPVIHEPKVLLIGINPGNGQSGNIDLSFWGDQEKFEYTNTDYSFALARETNAVFAEAGLSEILAKSTVKTNYYFLSTTKQNDLYKLTDWLGRKKKDAEELLGDKFFRKSAEWTKQLINIIAPKVIVCEGREAYNNVVGLFTDYSEQVWENECGYTIVSSQQLVIIGYSRMMSRIKNKSALAKLLKTFLSKA